MNKAGLRLLGYSQEELLGKNDYDFFPNEEASFFILADRKTLQGGQCELIEEESIHTKEGKGKSCGSKDSPAWVRWDVAISARNIVGHN
jgi:PAS domain S-box-containing protein